MQENNRFRPETSLQRARNGKWENNCFTIYASNLRNEFDKLCSDIMTSTVARDLTMGAKGKYAIFCYTF